MMHEGAPSYRKMAPEFSRDWSGAQNNVGKLSEFASCSASHIIGSHLTSEEQVAVQCAAQSDGDYGNFATCTGANLFNMRLNPRATDSSPMRRIDGGPTLCSGGLHCHSPDCTRTHEMLHERVRWF
jgi:hypothetical protein